MLPAAKWTVYELIPISGQQHRNWWEAQFVLCQEKAVVAKLQLSRKSSAVSALGKGSL